MAPPISPRDAAVALRSLPRRYGELVRGPKDDDGWDRLARTIGPGQKRSALGWLGLTTTMVSALGRAVQSVSTQRSPSMAMASSNNVNTEPSIDRSVDDELAALRTAAESAADAVDARRSDAAERVLQVDGNDVAMIDVISEVVQVAVAHLHDVQAALDAARFAR